MNKAVSITTENLAYWAQRSSGYSAVNKTELSGPSRSMWKNALHGRISSHYRGRTPESIRILDIGTGPGFFAIILAELGYEVTAVDMTPEMLAEAGINAGLLRDAIDFREMNAESLDLSDASYDVIVTRNLTWNLPHPELAYSEWCRVLKRGGLMLNFDSNWYSYLFNEKALQAYEADRAESEALGLGDQNVGENFDVMEDIARRMPLSAASRPAWDLSVLTALGMDAAADHNIWQHVWTRQEQVNFSSTPMFLVSAVRK